MIYIDADEDKKYITLSLVNHKYFPYGTQKFTYAINSLSIDAQTKYIKIQSTSTGGEQAFTMIDELYIGGVKANMNNVNELFSKECFTQISAVIDGDVNIDMSGVETLLEKISEQIKDISGGGGSIPSGDISAIMCKLGEVSCALDNINNEEIGGYISIDECERTTNIVDEINGEQIK